MGRKNRNRCPSRLLIFLSVPCLLILFPSFLEAKSIIFWMMPNEPVKEEIKRKSRDEIKKDVRKLLNDYKDAKGIIILNTENELVNNDPDFPDFACLVLSQTRILSEIDRFKQRFGEDKGEEISVKLRFIDWHRQKPDALKEIYQAARDKKRSPDIAQIDSLWTAYFIKNKLLEEITQFVDRESYYPISLDSCKPYGSDRLYAFPWSIDIRVLFYRKDLIKEVFKTKPTGWNPFKDRDSFRQTCKTINQLKEQGKINKDNFDCEIMAPFVIPTGKEWNLVHNLAPWIWGAGGDMFTIWPLGYKSASFSNKEGLDGLKFYAGLAREGCAFVSPKRQMEVDEEFIDGKYAMLISGPWMMEKLKDKLGYRWESKVGITLPPVNTPGRPDQRFAFVNGSNLVIFKCTKNRGNFLEALELTKFLSSFGFQRRYAKATGDLPALRNMLRRNASKYARYAVFVEALESPQGRSYPSLPELCNEVEREIVIQNFFDMWGAVDKGNLKGMKNELKEAAKSLNKCFHRPFYQLFLVLGFISTILWGSYTLLKKQRSEKEREKLRQERENLRKEIQELTEREQDLMRGFKMAEKEETEKRKGMAARIREYQNEIEQYRSQIQDLKERIKDEEIETRRHLELTIERRELTIEKREFMIERLRLRMEEDEKKRQEIETKYKRKIEALEERIRGLEERETEIGTYQPEERSHPKYETIIYSPHVTRDEVSLNVLLEPERLDVEIKKDGRPLPPIRFIRERELPKTLLFTYIAYQSFRNGTLPSNTERWEIDMENQFILKWKEDFLTGRSFSHIKEPEILRKELHTLGLQPSESIIRHYVRGIREDLKEIGAEGLLPFKPGRGQGYRIDGEIYFKKTPS